MANDSQFIGSGGTVSVDANGALGGDGSVSSPLDVLVDGVTVVKVANHLTAPSGGGGTIGGTLGAADNHVPRSDGTGGSTLQASAMVVSDGAVVSGVTLPGSIVTGAYTSSAMTLATAKMLGRATASSGAVEEIAVTGTGSAVLATSPVLVTPALGTPASGVMTNVTGLKESGLSFTDITTANTTSSQHGLAPKLSGHATDFLSGTGVFSIPGGGGNVLAAYVAKTGNYTLIWGTDGTVELTTNAGTFTLPTAVGHGGSGFIVKNAQTANALTLATTSGQTIDSASPGTLTNGALGIISDNANWRLVFDLGLALTSLTSGGVLFADTAGSIACSSVLAANNPVLGGGAGIAPQTVPGIDTDGVSISILGQSGTSTGAVQFNNTTSGSITLQPPASGALSGTLTLPIATDTLTGKATTDTFTHKTYDTVATGNVFKINGAQVNSIGSGLAITAGVLDASGAGGLTSAFTSAVVAGQTTVSTSGSTALTLVAGTNITLTTDNTAKSVTIDASGGGGGGTFPTIIVDKNGSDQVINNTTATQLTFGNVVLDSNSNFASNAFTPTVAGTYLVTAQAYFTDTTINTTQELGLHKNGTEIYVTDVRANGSQQGCFVIGTWMVQMNGSTDVLTIFGYGQGTNTGNTKVTISGNVETTFWHATRIGA